uniref:Transmembrane protein 11, mitochondrial n=1 Tax=Ciona intestinalis TaxID=7719 RepID=F6XGB5_CIOIN|nr:transmembrane protein 11, mitochondrial [Ciona intestinalis]|eukprot:XP_002121257.1 transmembrane protein 11, mitochondrial [Ciona intestinalis]
MDLVETTRVIREIYNEGNPQEKFEYELECALEAKVDYIVIEPTKLGEETSRWVRVGNCLHKTSVISGLLSLVLPRVFPETPVDLELIVGIPTAVLSVACTALYGISWQFDPCCKYQVTVNSRELSKLNVQNLTNSSPVVLVRRDDKYRKTLHNFVSFLAGIQLLRTLDNVWRTR